LEQEETKNKKVEGCCDAEGAENQYFDNEFAAKDTSALMKRKHSLIK
jgi:hypothetical protein